MVAEGVVAKSKAGTHEKRDGEDSRKCLRGAARFQKFAIGQDNQAKGRVPAAVAVTCMMARVEQTKETDRSSSAGRVQNTHTRRAREGGRERERERES